MLTEIDILKAVQQELKKIEARPVYIDDKKENFEAPCWFLKLTTARAQASAVKTHDVCDLYITYIDDLNAGNTFHLYQLKSSLQDAFFAGFYVKDRHITPDSVQTDICSNDGDILQCSIHFSYFDVLDPREYPLMKHFYDNYNA